MQRRCTALLATIGGNMESDTIATELRRRLAETGSLRKLAAALGLPVHSNAVLSKMVRGESVSAETARRVGRALGVTPPPRRLVRRCMTPAQALAWDALTHAERDALLGIPSP